MPRENKVPWAYRSFRRRTTLEISIVLSYQHSGTPQVHRFFLVHDTFEIRQNFAPLFVVAHVVRIVVRDDAVMAGHGSARSSGGNTKVLEQHPAYRVFQIAPWFERR